MADELKILVAQGLQALKAGGEVAKRATAEIQNDASDAGLKQALEQGNKTAEQWAQRVQRASGEAGPAENTGNPILEAHYEVSRKIRQKAPDAMSRDLGIIAAGQLALHYWIAAFGTLRTYAEKEGMTQTAGHADVAGRGEAGGPAAHGSGWEDHGRQRVGTACKGSGWPVAQP